jgi:hypothetical protein
MSQGDLLTDNHSVCDRQKNYFSILLNIHITNEPRQFEKQTADPSVPEPNFLEVKTATKNMKHYKSSFHHSHKEEIYPNGEIW